MAGDYTRVAFARVSQWALTAVCRTEAARHLSPGSPRRLDGGRESRPALREEQRGHAGRARARLGRVRDRGRPRDARSADGGARHPALARQERRRLAGGARCAPQAERPHARRARTCSACTSSRRSRWASPASWRCGRRCASHPRWPRRFLDLDELEGRARSQRERVESERLAFARAALAPALGAREHAPGAERCALAACADLQAAQAVEAQPVAAVVLDDREQHLAAARAAHDRAGRLRDRRGSRRAGLSCRTPPHVPRAIVSSCWKSSPNTPASALPSSTSSASISASCRSEALGLDPLGRVAERDEAGRDRLDQPGRAAHEG